MLKGVRLGVAQKRTSFDWPRTP